MHIDQYNKIVFAARVKRDNAITEADLFRIEKESILANMPGWLGRLLIYLRVIKDPAEVQEQAYIEARRVHCATITAAFREYKSTGGRGVPGVMPIDMPSILVNNQPMTLEELESKIGYPPDMEKPSTRPN